ncbi:MAG TPA: DUF2961 domain-containing protein [Candidatus Hydrogenedentes bacterium]|nr:DUF2961 domain-containing protein [Candidatus Hydrogenedentota bacterium]
MKAFAVIALLAALPAWAYELSELPNLDVPRIRAENALWVENPLEEQFVSAKTVVVARLEGPGRIEMMHFAMPGALKLGREAILRIYWDDAEEPSVNCPLVDFFCDPAGQFESVETVVLNKRRGFNCYFPMPYRKSARVEVAYDGELPPGQELQSKMPCYSYVMYRTLESLPLSTGYFHANWHQESLPLGRAEYIALDTQGKGKFIGWSVTIRKPGAPAYMVDMNEMFYVDGEGTPSVEFQGIEDAFGFSWGFPETESEFLVSGYRKYFQGAAAYKFFLNDAIPFEQSLRVTIDFAKNENETVKAMVGDEGYYHELSSVCYWYQAPASPVSALPSLEDRQPAPDDNPAWPHEEVLPTAEELRSRGTKFYMLCGRPEKEVVHAEEGYALGKVDGYSYAGWPGRVYHTRASQRVLAIELEVPPSSQGILRLYIADPDHFMGGRKQEIRVGGKSVGVFDDFQEGKWIETPVDATMTQGGTIRIEAENLRTQGNAVISIVEWREQ